MELDINQIKEILPHRYPMLLIDRITELDPLKYAVGIKCVTTNEPFFQGHFPEKPIMPGALICEAMAQVGGIALQYPEENRRPPPLLHGHGQSPFPFSRHPRRRPRHPRGHQEDHRPHGQSPL